MVSAIFVPSPSLVPARAAMLLSTPVALVLGLGLMLPAVAGAEPDDAGFVLNVEGTWLLQAKPPQKISGGENLLPGTTIYPEQEGPNSFVVICFYTGDAKTYRKKTTLPAMPATSLVESLVAAFRGQKRSGLVHAISRGENDLAGGVVKITDRGIDVGPLLAELKPGTCLLRFSSQPEADTQPTKAPPTKTQPVKTEPAKTQPVVGTVERGENDGPILLNLGLAPALYKVELLDRRTREPAGSEALLLVCDAGAYDEASRAYQGAVELTKRWDPHTRKHGAALFLELNLQALADQATR